ncbi:MAG: hypothetical protein ACYS0I_05680 [Planctomycetota bacterium]|jgi:asparagine synthase (glutamine-hydrolysing)
MCGICDIYNRSPDVNLPGAEIIVKRMTHTLSHRGPDDMGVYVEGPIALGTARLAVIDLSSSAHQPMILDDGDHVICFNGEIYNYRYPLWLALCKCSGTLFSIQAYPQTATG